MAALTTAPPFAEFRFLGEVVRLNQRQFNQALADSKLCRCRSCLVCRTSEYHRETKRSHSSV